MDKRWLSVKANVFQDVKRWFRSDICVRMKIDLNHWYSHLSWDIDRLFVAIHPLNHDNYVLPCQRMLIWPFLSHFVHLIWRLDSLHLKGRPKYKFCQNFDDFLGLMCSFWLKLIDYWCWDTIRTKHQTHEPISGLFS